MSKEPKHLKVGAKAWMMLRNKPTQVLVYGVLQWLDRDLKYYVGQVSAGQVSAGDYLDLDDYLDVGAEKLFTTKDEVIDSLR